MSCDMHVHGRLGIMDVLARPAVQRVSRPAVALLTSFLGCLSGVGNESP